ncbi:MAG: hypothetical protein MK102_19410 [Fuerstiella sp.]|nr:hypothetical protein [Fuerstiella sp.]
MNPAKQTAETEERTATEKKKGSEQNAQSPLDAAVCGKWLKSSANGRFNT